MKKLIVAACALFGTHTGFSQNIFPTTASSYAGIGTTTPATALHILYNNTSTLNPANFITIDNRGSNAASTSSYVIGGLLFSGYQTGKSPANVAGIWATRYASPTPGDGSTSGGVLNFGTTNTAANIGTDHLLPTAQMILTQDPCLMLNCNLINSNLSRPSLASNGAGEIRGISATGAWADDGFLRLSAGGGTATNTKSYIDLSGYTASTSDRQMNITFGTQGLERMRITLLGNILIGKTSQANTAYMLDVAGTVRVNQLVVNTTGADFVFEPGYKLAPLSKVEEFIKANHHLQGIAPAAQMQKDGVDVGDNQTKLLQKVEELTLYIIELEKKTDKQQSEIEELKKKAN